MLELGMGRAAVPALLLGKSGGRALAAVCVDHDSIGDRQHPRPEVSGMTERRIAAQCSEEGLLEGILRALPAQPANEESEDEVAVLLVETLERGQGHVVHHGA